jgi:hypothetical protein
MRTQSNLNIDNNAIRLGDWANMAAVCMDTNNVCCLASLEQKAIHYEKSGEALCDVLYSLFPDEVVESSGIKYVKENGESQPRDEICVTNACMYIRTCTSKATKVVKNVIIPMIKRMFPRAKITFTNKTVSRHKLKIQNCMMVNIKSLHKCDSLLYINVNKSLKEMRMFVYSKSREWCNIR